MYRGREREKERKKKKKKRERRERLLLILKEWRQRGIKTDDEGERTTEDLEEEHVEGEGTLSARAYNLQPEIEHGVMRRLLSILSMVGPDCLELLRLSVVVWKTVTRARNDTK